MRPPSPTWKGIHIDPPTVTAQKHDFWLQVERRRKASITSKDVLAAATIGHDVGAGARARPAMVADRDPRVAAPSRESDCLRASASYQTRQSRDQPLIIRRAIKQKETELGRKTSLRIKLAITLPFNRSKLFREDPKPAVYDGTQSKLAKLWRSASRIS
ncbi:hypothetical protein EVAR_93345_1 [Eumeta japonica]|uniref:Uncharacterized protein n=1 Tax=Eumeta variegata TaxID=151549 RepID=A0A4C1USY3_EUMVA|nr:hypothetical protein EVAR_93345_1 [Eumeta japonica]